MWQAPEEERGQPEYLQIGMIVENVLTVKQ